MVKLYNKLPKNSESISNVSAFKRKLFKQHISLLLISIILITNNIYSQTKLENIELNTQRSIEELNSKKNNLGNKNKTLSNNLNLLSTSATILFNKINNNEIVISIDDTMFIRSLDQSQQVLNQLSIDWSSNKDAARIMDAIRIDYDIKIKSSALGTSTTIEVSVVTKSKNQNVAGYDVFYTSMWEPQKKNYFNNQTNNAIKKLSPGYYLFWIEKNGVLIQSKPKVEIGNLMLPKDTLIFNL